MSRINDALARASSTGQFKADAATPASLSTEVPAGIETFDATPSRDLFPAESSAEALAGDARVARLPDEPRATGAAGLSRTEALGPMSAELSERLVVGSMCNSSLEQYRRLAAVLHQMHLNTGVRVVMVASAVAGEGKTLTSANLALTFSESYRRRVLLIDADLRRPSVHSLFGLANLDGLTDALKSGGERKICARAVSSTLSVVTAGRPDSDQLAHLTSSRMQLLLQEASQVHEWVIIDTPPVALLSDAKLLAAMVDGALLVVRAGTTPYPIVQRAIQAIGPERILGTVLNGAEVSAVAGHSYYEGYYEDERPRWHRSWWQRRSRKARLELVDEPPVPGPSA